MNCCISIHLSLKTEEGANIIKLIVDYYLNVEPLLITKAIIEIGDRLREAGERGVVGYI